MEMVKSYEQRKLCFNTELYHLSHSSVFKSIFLLNNCCLVTKSCSNLCDPMDCSTPGFPVLHYFSEFAQTHIHWVSDTIQPSHPLPLPSPSAFNLSKLQGLFQWIGSSHQVTKAFELQLLHQLLSCKSENIHLVPEHKSEDMVVAEVRREASVTLFTHISIFCSILDFCYFYKWMKYKLRKWKAYVYTHKATESWVTNTTFIKWIIV